MDYELKSNKVNRLKLARVFHDHKRVDMSIDCMIEGQMGRVYVDDLSNPTAYRITTGPFWYFAGGAKGPGAYQMMKDFPAYDLIMPSPPEWLDLARKIFGANLQPFARYQFSSASLSSQHLTECLERSGYRERIIPISLEIAKHLSALPESYLELSEFDSIQDFLDRGLGYTVLEGDRIMGVAYSSLVCSKGIEVSIFVEDSYRQKGVATALAGRLILECIKLDLQPNWDAANPESCKLAIKLGYTFMESYDAYYHTLNKNGSGQRD